MPVIHPHEIERIGKYKPTFYEQVTDVKLLFLLFFHRAFAFVVGSVAPHVVVLSIRTLLSFLPLKLGAGRGSVGESMLPFVRRPRSGPKSARSHRNAGLSQQVNEMAAYISTSLTNLETFSQAATSTLRGAFLRLLLNSDTAEDGDRDRTVGAGGDFPAENVAPKFIGAHLSGVVIVRKS